LVCLPLFNGSDPVGQLWVVVFFSFFFFRKSSTQGPAPGAGPATHQLSRPADSASQPYRTVSKRYLLAGSRPPERQAQPGLSLNRQFSASPAQATPRPVADSHPTLLRLPHNLAAVFSSCAASGLVTVPKVLSKQWPNLLHYYYHIPAVHPGATTKGFQRPYHLHSRHQLHSQPSAANKSIASGRHAFWPTNRFGC
jgi:hypothetical protein